MPQSNTLYVSLDVHQDSIAVADVAKDHDAEIIYLGTIGSRQCDIEQLVRMLQSKAKHLIFAYEAGPCGYWLCRDLTKTGLYLLRRHTLPHSQQGGRPGENGSV